MLFGHRVAVRAVVLSPERDVLLFCIRAPDQRRCWFTPGGGLEPGESHEQCLRRELDEELGLQRFELGPLLGRHQFISMKAFVPTRNEHFIYLVHTPRIEPVMRDCRERQSLEEIRWLALSELLSPREPVYPIGLIQRVSRLLDTGDTRPEHWL
jgi:8-oxo-dGTP pyrophosphatase MutT (NUDIX family)